MPNLAPIILFVYNRPWHTRQTIAALQQNWLVERSQLRVYADAAPSHQERKAVEEVRSIVSTTEGFQSVQVCKRQTHLGLSCNIIEGVSETLNQYGRAIVLEDDLVTSPYFLKFMNQALDTYQSRPDIFSISGYNHPPSKIPIPKHYREDVYLSYRNSSWGWATWANCWNRADWLLTDFERFQRSPQMQQAFNRGGEDLTAMLFQFKQGKIDSWAIRWAYAHFKHSAFALYPVHSYTKNIGHDGSGTHCGQHQSPFVRWRRGSQNDLRLAKCEPLLNRDIRPDPQLLHNFRRVYKPSLKRRLKLFLNRLIPAIMPNPTR